MTVPVKAAQARAIREAMLRLVKGKPRRSDGALTLIALAREAAVSRSTLYRAIELRQEFERLVRKVKENGSDVRGLKAEIMVHKRALSEEKKRHFREVSLLRNSLKTVAQQVQLLTLDNERLRHAIAGSAKVTVLNKRSK